MRSAAADYNARVLTNLVRQPRPTTIHSGAGYGTQNLSIVTGINGPGGTTTAVRVRTDANVATNNPGYLFDMRPAIVGEILVMSAWVFLEYGQGTGFGFAISAQASGKDQGEPLSPGVWTRYTWTIKATLGNAIGFRFASRAAGNNIDGSSFLITNIMVESQSSLHMFHDDKMPGWKKNADGTSSGYEYTLERILGKIDMDIYGSGQIVPSSRDAFTGMTALSVYMVTNLSTSYGTWVAMGSSSGRMAFQTGVADTANVNPRVDTQNGTSNSSLTYSQGRSLGYHVGAMRVETGMAQWSIAIDGRARSVRTLTPGEGMPSSTLTAGAPSGMIPIRTIGLLRPLTDTAEDAALRWLSHYYGTPYYS